MVISLKKKQSVGGQFFYLFILFKSVSLVQWLSLSTTTGTGQQPDALWSQPSLSGSWMVWSVKRSPSMQTRGTPRPLSAGIYRPAKLYKALFYITMGFSSQAYDKCKSYVIMCQCFWRFILIKDCIFRLLAFCPLPKCSYFL